jgi:nicotinamidase-related amidase
MKKTLTSLLILLLSGFCTMNAQEKKQQAKEKIKPALLVIDVQNAFVPIVPEREKAMAIHYINGLIDLFRANGYPVIRIYHTSEKYGPKVGTPEFEFIPDIKINADDPKVIKTYGDGFNKTDLDQVIKEKGSNTLFLCGLSAVGCVLSTWIGAQNHDYKAFLVKGALMSHNSEYTNNVEQMFDAVAYDMVELIIEHAEK